MKTTNDFYEDLTNSQIKTFEAWNKYGAGQSDLEKQKKAVGYMSEADKAEAQRRGLNINIKLKCNGEVENHFNINYDLHLFFIHSGS